jgi:hypothetical protein
MVHTEWCSFHISFLPSSSEWRVSTSVAGAKLLWNIIQCLPNSKVQKAAILKLVAVETLKLIFNFLLENSNRKQTMVIASSWMANCRDTNAFSDQSEKLNGLLHTYYWKWTLPTMYALTLLRITAMKKWFITHATGKWTLSAMYELMCVQITALNEWLFTHITGKWSLSSTYEFTFLQITAVTEWFVTHITRKWMPQYVCVDVSSDYCSEWMICYKHYTN